MLRSVIFLAVPLAALSATVPSFPDVWQSNTVGGIAIFQGGEKKPDGSVCCEPSSPQCKIQTITQSGMTYNDGDNNRTRSDTAQGIIVNWFGSVGKQMALAPNPSGKGLVCEAACPVQGGYSNPLKIAANAKDKGQVTINGKAAEEFVFYDTLLKIVRMDEKDVFVDLSGAKPAPVSVIEKLIPFDIPIIHPTKELGESATNYTNFSTQALDPEIFDIANCTAQHCDCPPPKNGCNQNNDLEAQLFQRSTVQEPPTIMDRAVSAGASAAEVVEETQPAANGTFPNDWSATEAALMVINQAGIKEADGSYCCLPEATTQCQIQLSAGGGQRYMDYSNQRTRLEELAGDISVDDYKALKSMDVVHNTTTGKDTCQKYCPIDKEDTLDGGAQYFLNDKAKDLGATTFDGKAVNEWQWKDMLLKIIQMSVTNFYATQDSNGNYSPVAQVQDITPLGRQLGQSNLTWTEFTPGKQPQAKFEIAGMDECPMDPQCNSPQRQLRRLRNRQYVTFAKYQKMMV